MSRPRPRLRPLSGLVLAVLALALAPACGGSLRDSGGGRVEYSVSARTNYERGMKKLADEDYSEAARYFSFVKARFPYSKFAVLAELRLADTVFGSGGYLEAIDAYKMFLKFHPTHEMVENGYAAYKIGESYYRMVPESWFMVPPAFEMDNSPTVDALRELTDFARRYPNSPYIGKVEKMRKRCARELAAHEWYVANFYWKRDRPMGTVLRLRTLLTRYPDSGYDEDALWLLGKAYVRVGRRGDAQKTWRTLVDKYPKSKRAGDARQALSRLRSG